MAVKTLRPVAVSGPLTGANMRVVWDDRVVAVVSQRETRYLQRAPGEIQTTTSGRNVIPTTEGILVAVQQGGCSCGKPWLTKPSAADLLANAPA